MPVEIDRLLARHEELKNKKRAWLPIWQAIAHSVLLRKQTFLLDSSDGPFVFNQVFDSTAIHALHLMSASLLGQIWPNPFESFEFVPQVAQDFAAFSDAYDMMNTVNDVMPTNLSLPEAGVMTAFHECFQDAGAFGTGAVAIIQTNDYSCPVAVRAIDSKTLSFDENDRGSVDTVYIEKEYTVGTIVQKFGLDAVSERVRKLHKAAELGTKVKVVHVIEPRRERNPLKLGNLDMKYASVHIDVADRHIIKESGFQEMPILVFRFWKNPGELWGRSPAMDALSDIRALNKLVEIFEKSGEMALNPPKLVSTEDVMGAGKIPWFPGANIPTHMSGRMGNEGRPPVEIIHTVGNPSWASQRIIDLRDSVKQYFMMDILSDLNNTSRQTLGEANIRNELRMFQTGPMLIRFLIELVGPFLDRAFNIMLEMGLFGVVRGSLQDIDLQMQGIQPKYLSEDFIMNRTSGFKGYRINYISPAARLMKLEESLGLDNLTAYTLSLAPIYPVAQQMFDAEQAIRTKQKLSGATQKALRSPAALEKIRQMQAAQDAEVAQLQAAGAQAAAFKDAAAGVKNIGGAVAGSR